MTAPRTSTSGAPPVPRETMDRVLDLVRQGYTLRSIALMIGYAHGETISSWRKLYPPFAAELDAAKAEGKAARRHPDAPERVLTRVRAGATIAQAAEAERVSHGTVQRWARLDPSYRAELTQASASARAVRSSRRSARAKADVLTWIGKGKSANEACRLAGVTSATVSKWRSDDPGFDAEHARLVGPTRRPRGWVKFRRMLPLIRAGATVWNAARVVGLGPWPVYVWWEKQPAMWAEIVAAYEASGRTPPRRRVKSADERRAA